MALKIGIELAGADLLAVLTPRHAARFAESLDASGAVYAVIGGERDATAPEVSPSATIAGPLLSRHTRRVGLVVAASPQRDHPYNIARRTASLDHFSAGRAGWLALRRDRGAELGIGDTNVWTEARADAETLADAVLAIRRLWRSWPLDSLSADPAVADGALVRIAGHEGRFPTRGPLNSPDTPQGEPLVFWRWQADAPVVPELTAVRSADLVQVHAAELDEFLHVAGKALDKAHEAGAPVQIHVRTPWDADLEARLSQWRNIRHLAGVTLLSGPGELGTWLAQGRLARLTGATSPVSAAPATLRASLGTARRLEPDLSGNAPAFKPVAKVAA